MTPKMRWLGIASSTFIFLVGWVMVLGFVFREWHAVPQYIRLQLVAVAVGYPVPWAGMALSKFAERRMMTACYVIMMVTVMVLLQFVPRPR